MCVMYRYVGSTNMVVTRLSPPSDANALFASPPACYGLCYLLCILRIVLVQAGEDLHVWGTGSPLRQFIYNVDLGALMVGYFSSLLVASCLFRCS